MFYSGNIKKYSNLFDTFRSFYYASKFLGTAAFTITVKSDCNIDIRTTLTDYIIFVIFNIIYGFIVYMWSIGKLTSHIFDTSSDVANYGNQLTIFSSVLFTITMNLITFVFRKRTIEILNDLIKIDFSMKMLNIRVDYKSQSKMVNNYLVACLVIIVVLGVGSSIVFYKISANMLLDFTIFGTVLLNNLYYVNFISQWILCLLSVYERFRQLNQGLEEIFQFKKLYENQDFSDAVKRIAKIHDSLIEIVQKINYRFSVWIMFIFAVIFVFFTLNTFSFVTSIIMYERSKFLFSIAGFVWFLNNLLFLVMGIAAGSRTTRMVFFLNLLLYPTTKY